MLGIDIDPVSIKLVELEKGRDRFNLKLLREISLPPGIFEAFLGSESIECLSVVSSYLKKLLENPGIRTNNAAVAIPAEQSFVSVIDLPPMPEDEIKVALKWEIKKQIPDYPEEKNASWKIVGKSNAGFEVLVVAVPRFLTSRYLNIIKESGLKPYSIEIEPLSLARSLTIGNEGAIIIVHFGTKFSSVNLIDNGILRISRSLKVGENEMIKSLVGVAGDIEKAKKMLYEIGFFRAKKVGKVYNALNPLFSSLTSEIKRFSGFFQEKTTREVSRVILSGGPATIPDIMGHISESVLLPVNIVNPWAKVDYSSMPNQDQLVAIGCQYAIAVGLAMA